MFNFVYYLRLFKFVCILSEKDYLHNTEVNKTRASDISIHISLIYNNDIQNFSNLLQKKNGNIKKIGKNILLFFYNQLLYPKIVFKLIF